MKTISFVTLLAALLLGCGGSSSGVGGVGGAGGAGGTGDASGTGGAQSATVEVTDASFDCILDGTKVRKFYVKNLIGDLEGSLAVANGNVAPPYPPGTLIQLVPQEAMVKRELGFSPVTGDWEFFFLNTSSAGTTIAQRGKDEAQNAFGANCFDCHVLAADNDFVCETDHGCDPLQIDDAFIEMLQLNDVRCN